MIDVLLVPQGAEYTAVCNGLRGVSRPPVVLPVAAGPAIARSLAQLQQTGCLVRGQTVLMMGLCGGLVPELAVGDGVVYEDCYSAIPGDSGADRFTGDRFIGDRALTMLIRQQLNRPIQSVNAITCDRVVSTASEKQQLARQFAAQVVDMEGAVALSVLSRLEVSVATLRVVSDDCTHDIPNLAQIFTPEGTLKPLALTLAMLRQPLPALHLIRGALTSLKILQLITTDLFKD